MDIYVYDIETFKNIFTVIFVNLNDKEDKHEFIIFKDLINDNDINDYLKIIAFVNDSNKYLLGYNSFNYDDIMLKYILMNGYKFNKLDKMLSMINEFSNLLIEVTKNGSIYQNDTTRLVKMYGVKFKGIDFQKYMALDKAMKSLKQALINIKYPNILEFELPEISDKDKHLYSGAVLNQPKLISVWDRYILAEWIPELMVYNMNDVDGLRELVLTYMDELKSRFDVSIEYGLNVLNSSRADVANTILIHEYSKESNMIFKEYRDKATLHKNIKLKEVILNNVTFITPIFKKALTELKDKTIVNTRKELEYTIIFDGVKYQMGAGGLHSADIPKVFKANNETYLRDADGTSYYPMLMILYNIFPKHTGVWFKNIFSRIVYKRVEVKNPNNPTFNAKLAGILKIVINSVFGKLGFEFGWLYDRKAMVQVTINGQLFLLMLVERLSLIGVKTISANTDGIVCKVPHSLEDEYFKVCKQWEKDTKVNLEYTDYKVYVRENVNSYITVKTDGKIKRKGAMNRNKATDELSKAFTMPIIAIAIENYYVKGIPVVDTINKHSDIYDFCMSQNTGGKFTLELHSLKDDKLHIEALQKANRFYISTNGGTLIKRADIMKGGDNSVSNIMKGKRVTIFNNYIEREMRDYHIDYKYYIAEANKRVTVINLSLNTKGKTKKGYKTYVEGGMFSDEHFK